jgi:hypothetical protein
MEANIVTNVQVDGHPVPAKVTVLLPPTHDDELTQVTNQ